MPLTLVVSVTRALTVPPAADLSLDQTGVYEIVSMGPGDMVHEKEEVTSLWVDGATLVSSRKGLQTAALKMRVKGSTDAILDANLTSLLRAFEQFTYTMNVSINGVARSWKCEPADYSIGDSGTWQPHHLMAKQEEVTFVVPRQPIPTTGTY